MSNNTIIQEKKRKLPRSVYLRQNKNYVSYYVCFKRDKQVWNFGSYSTIEEAEEVAVSIREQLEKESIEIVKKRFDQERSKNASE